MSSVTPELIKRLRERTGVGIGKCKSALEENEGDIERSIEFLRKAGIASAVKKESRSTNEGRIEWSETPEGVAILELNAETDFVVNNERFAKFHKELVQQAVVNAPESLEAFLAQPGFTGEGKTIDDERKELVSVLGENIVVSRLVYLTKRGDASFGVYSHMGGKILTMVELEGAAGEEEFAREIAMHVAAEAPDYLKPEDVPAEVKAKEEEIASSQIPSNKPPEILEKILQGKMRAFYDQVCLLNQKYVKDNTKSITELVADKAKETGKSLRIAKFIRWHVGG